MTFKATPVFKTKILPTLIAGLLSTQAVATEKDTDNKDIEKIVVVGATTNSEITPEQLDNYQANDLEDIFRATPSITVGGSLGIVQKVFVRGLEDSMMNITVDGAPQTSTLFHHVGRVSIEPELLRSVEVQAGAGEATAGSGAVGGAIRFKTKTANDLLNADEQFGGLAKASIFSNDGNKQSVALYGRVTDSVNVLASYVNVSRDNMEDGEGDLIPGTGSDQALGFVKVDAEISDSQFITVSYETREEEGEFGKQTNWVQTIDAPLFKTWSDRETLVLNHALYLNEFINLETTLYSTESSLKRELYTWNAGIKTTGFDIRNTSDLGDHVLTYGIEQKNDEVNSESYEAFGGKANEDGTVTGVYAQDHWQITPDLLLSFGVRYDAYELDHTGLEASWVKVDGKWVVEHDAQGNPVTKSKDFSVKKQDGFSKNIGFKYTLAENITLSAGYAEALRGRQVADAFTAGEVNDNPELAPEEVENIELGLEYNDGTWLFEASVYQSTINGVVFDKFKGREGVFYENIGDLESTGVELVAGYQANQFDVLVSFNHNDVVLNNMPFIWPDNSVEGGKQQVIRNNVDINAYEYGGLGNAVGDALNINFNYEVTDSIKTGFNFKYVADLNDIEVMHRSLELGWVDELGSIDKEGYNLVDVYARYEPTEQLRFDLSIQNLFNETYRSHGSVGDFSKFGKGYETLKGMYEPGRDIRLSVSYQF
ncbi:TonB-dependent receptor [Pseudoalteromonas phenolica]|uniref:TonB-dependent receptor n=1 Tax=Pseudoalteromonas phenolica TaxID=161398 RepID=A0A0S2K925_9GAMM|nr:TonB-dependent receptor [Pseudoalteromonas phenolica]ALO44532.1 TonB-dependent receptor [Pseudoalteromonas phenolica]MBE0357559.1 hemoglobin/transferrin/lactoferrin receptor protein [Pseudoalteromonas phenolica O-BC30]RXE98444.1 TonB-dependent receptor [Pseudoalteromonas phenolica O-BC30]